MVKRALLACMSALAWGSASAAGIAVEVTDLAGQPVADVVVSLVLDGEAGPVKDAARRQIEQRGLKFIPLVSVIQTGTTMLFPNNDKVRHHIYSFSPAKKFDQKLYSGVAAAPQVFDQPGTVVLGCNIHDRMIAYVKVVDTPHFAKTDSNGRASFSTPPGKGSLEVWHPLQAGQPIRQEVTVTPGDGPTALRFRLALKAPAASDDANYGW
jgi:plastocyanin